MKIVFCTHNANKVAEVARVAGTKFEFLTLSDIQFNQEIPEPFPTLEENANTKAETVFIACGLACFSEDSGLFTIALNGEPGVQSARYAGEEANAANNMAKLLTKMEGQTNRRAYFKTIIALKLPNQNTLYFAGECHGTLRDSPIGMQGFGYDPIFIPDGDTRSFAEMNLDEKNQYSHRRKAVDAFLSYLNLNFN